MQHVSGQQQLCKHVPAVTDTNATTKERYFLYGPCREVITGTAGAMSSIEFCMGGWEKITLLLSGITSCGVLANEQWRDHKSWRISIVKIRYQETTSESRLKKLLMICEVCKSAIALHKWSINPFTNRNPVYSHNSARDNIICFHIQIFCKIYCFQEI
jgi:hypothetical protein